MAITINTFLKLCKEWMLISSVLVIGAIIGVLSLLGLWIKIPTLVSYMAGTISGALLVAALMADIHWLGYLRRLSKLENKREQDL